MCLTLRYSLWLIVASLFSASCISPNRVSEPLGGDVMMPQKKNTKELPIAKRNKLDDKSQEQNDKLEIEKHSEQIAVKKWINFYTQEGRQGFQAQLNRGLLYKNQIQAILRSFDLPTNLYYLALIESGFKVNAISSARAVGTWQFMTGTAKNYGLRMNEVIDERRDPLRSTIAAALYLKSLRNVFDSWPLALAAYNAGESRIMNIIIRAGTRDYWQLGTLGVLPSATRVYVPQFVAATIIGENPERYGLKIEQPEHPNNVVAVSVPTPVLLETIAEKAGISLEKLKFLNPHFLKNYTPPHFRSYRIWLPANGSNYSQLSRLETIVLKTPPHKRKIAKGGLVCRKGKGCNHLSSSHKKRKREFIVRKD